jgi:hypothetical protein
VAIEPGASLRNSSSTECLPSQQVFSRLAWLIAVALASAASLELGTRYPH